MCLNNTTSHSGWLSAAYSQRSCLKTPCVTVISSWQHLVSQSSSPDNTLCHGHLLRLPDQPYLTAHTNLWDSGGLQTASPAQQLWEGRSFSHFINYVWVAGAKQDRASLQGIPELLSRVSEPLDSLYWGQNSLGTTASKSTHRKMSSLIHGLQRETSAVPPFPVSTPKESWVWKGAAPPCRHGGDLLNTPRCWSLASEKQRTMSSV